jgi:preprotein translocase subunit SecD
MLEKVVIKMVSNPKSVIFILIIISLSFGCQAFSKIFNNSGGTELIVQVETDEQNKDKLVEQAVNMLKTRLNVIKVNGEVVGIADKPDQISVKLYGANDLEKIKKYLLTTYKLELKAVVSPSSPSPMQTFPNQAAALAGLKDTNEVLPYHDRSADTSPKFVIVEKKSIVTGADVRSASAVNSNGSSYAITFSLKPEGATKLGDWTGRNINSYLAIVVDREVVSAAFIRSQIFDSGQIDGRFTKETAEDIANSLNSGYFSGTLKLIEAKTFGDSGK